MRLRLLPAAAAVVVSSAVLTAQTRQDLPQFRGGVELVKVDVTVLDGQRRPVLGLTADDFVVKDDGVVRPVRAFTPVRLTPESTAPAPVWASSVPPDVATNAVADEPGRLVVIVMDRSIPLHEPTFVARKIAKAAVASLGPHDLAALVSTSNGAIQPLTADRGRLLRAIDSGDPSTGMSKEALEIMNMPPGVPLNPLSDGRCICGVCVLDTVTRVADALRQAPLRRKVVLFIGSEIVWQTAQSTTTDIGCGDVLRDARKAMFAAVDRANVTIHSIDPVSLSVVGPQTRAAQPGLKPNQPRGLFMTMQQAETSEALQNQDSLRVLPDRTGGRTIVNRNDPEAVVPDIYRESAAYYILGFERGRDDRPGREHTIDVEVRRKGVRVHAQRHYIEPAAPPGGTAPSPAAPPERGDVAAALTGLLPSAGKPLTLDVNVLAGSDPERAEVRLSVDVGAFVRGRTAPVPLELTVLAADPAGRPIGSARQTSTVSAAGGAGEVDVQSRLELPPGSYGLRVAVADPSTGAVASVFSEVSVPRFDTAPLTLSDLVVEASPAGDPAGFVPVSRRTFRRGEVVRVSLQVYQGLTRTDALAAGTLRVRILDARGGAVHEEELRFGPDTFTARRANCVIQLPFSQISRGEYLLSVNAAVGGQHSDKAIRFAIE